MRQLCGQMDDDKSCFDLPEGTLSRLGAEDAWEEENVSSNGPRADLTEAVMSCRALRDR